MKSEQRSPKVYWVQKKQGEKDLLIFDGGHWSGDIHIYEYKESRPSKEIEKEVKLFLKTDEIPELMKDSMVRTWIEKNFGYPVEWYLTSLNIANLRKQIEKEIRSKGPSFFLDDKNKGQ
jgi:hypothetical protein